MIGNLAVGFLGSYTLTVTVVRVANGAAITKFHAWNTSNMGSATHAPVIGHLDAWKEQVEPVITARFARRGPLSPVKQTFDWTEAIPLTLQAQRLKPWLS